MFPWIADNCTSQAASSTLAASPLPFDRPRRGYQAEINLGFDCELVIPIGLLFVFNAANTIAFPFPGQRPLARSENRPVSSYFPEFGWIQVWGAELQEKKHQYTVHLHIYIGVTRPGSSFQHIGLNFEDSLSRQTIYHYQLVPRKSLEESECFLSHISGK